LNIGIFIGYWDGNYAALWAENGYYLLEIYDTFQNPQTAYSAPYFFTGSIAPIIMFALHPACP
jgi:hypothetical protein